MLGGRVKTLHPKVHGGLLFRRKHADDQKQAAEHGIAPIDLVVVNLYPFEATAAKDGLTAEELIENIDIGGPTMLRSAAKNFESVTVVSDPQIIARVAEELETTRETSLTTKSGTRAKSFCRHLQLRRKNHHGAGTPLRRARRRRHRRTHRLSAESRLARTCAHLAAPPAGIALRRKSSSGRGALRSGRPRTRRIWPPRSNSRARSFPTTISSISKRRAVWPPNSSVPPP